MIEVIDDVQFYKWVVPNDEYWWKVIIPPTLVPLVLWCVHDSPGAGHMGQTKTFGQVDASIYIWKGQRQDVQEHVQTCDICEEKKNPQRAKIHRLKKYTTGPTV